MENRTVVIISEDSKLNSNIEKILVTSGYIPITVNDAMLAVGAIQSKPDVILLELRMLQKNGFAISGAINKAFKTRRIPFIAISDLLKDEFSWILSLCGIKKWLKKSFQPLDIIWAIENEINEIDTGNQWGHERHHAGMEIMA